MCIFDIHREIIYKAKTTFNESKLFDYGFYSQMKSVLERISRLQDGSEGKGSCHTSLVPKCNPWNPYGGGSREALISTCTLHNT